MSPVATYFRIWFDLERLFTWGHLRSNMTLFQNKLNFVISEIIRVFYARTDYFLTLCRVTAVFRTAVRIRASPYRPESIEIKKVSFMRSFMCVHESNLRFIWFGLLHYYAPRCKPSPGSCDPESEVKWGQTRVKWLANYDDIIWSEGFEIEVCYWKA